MQKQALLHRKRFFMTNIFRSPRLGFYAQNKFKLELPKYWDSQLPFTMKTEFCRFICSCHGLSIEMGRKLNIPRENRLCLLCKTNVVEDEVHFLLMCPALHDIRTNYIPSEYWTRPGLNAAVSLFINPGRRDELIKFCFYAAKKREKLMVAMKQQTG